MIHSCLVPLQIASATTMALDGGCTFEELCTRARRGYACDNMVNIEGLSFDDAKEELIKHVGNCIRRLEAGSSRTVMKFYIGKTYVNKKKQPGGGDLPLNPQDSSTYTKDGISSRWGNYKQMDYGRDGMVVLTIVTPDVVPSAKQPLHLEDYTCNLKSGLIDYFSTTSPYKDRMENTTSSKGKRDVQGSAAYALYVAYSLEETTIWLIILVVNLTIVLYAVAYVLY